MSTGANMQQSPPSAVYMFPASFGQRRLWLNEQKNPGRALYNIPYAVRAKGPLDLDAFHRSVHEVVRRHESLRTRFVPIDGNPQQAILAELDFDVPLIDLRSLPAKEREQEAQRLVQADITAPFDMGTAPLWRVTLFRLQEQEHVILLVMHHIISDGWSMGVMLSEMSIIYTAFLAGKPSPLPELPIQYADFSEWERELLAGKGLQPQLDYWTKRLSGTPALKLPYDRPKKSSTPTKGGAYFFRVEADLAEGLRQLGQRQNATLHMTLLAAYQTLLYRYTGQQDIAVGNNIARRNRPTVEGLIGYLSTNVIMRTKLQGDWSFSELLSNVRETALGAYAHQDIPLDRVVQELAAERDPSRPLIFHVTFTLQNLPQSNSPLGPTELTPFETQIAPAKHDIQVFITDTGSALVFGVLYNMDLFDPETIAGIFEHYSFLLQSIVDDPGQQLARLPLCNRWREGDWKSVQCRDHAQKLPA
ncbi:MAG: hypothetical protein LAO76_21995 [Acidobacteriia bacterium]|nr:hypothetical protein [Terriglobia bacterium]